MRGAALPSLPGLPNSPWLMPIFSSTHSMASISPVVTATRGRLTARPSLVLRGNRVGLSGSASATVVVVQAALLQVLLTRRVGGLKFRRIAPHLAKVSVASLLMAGVVAAGWAWWARVAGEGAGGGWELLGLVLVVGAGVAVFGGAALALRVEGLAEMVALVRRKLRLGGG